MAFFVLIAWSIIKDKSSLDTTVSILGILLVVLIASHYGYVLNKATINKTTQKMYNDWVLNAADFRHNKAMHTLTIKQYGMRCLMLAVEAITCVAEVFFLANETNSIEIGNNSIIVAIPVAIGIVSLVLAFGFATALIIAFALALMKPLNERAKKRTVHILLLLTVGRCYECHLRISNEIGSVYFGFNLS